MKIILALIVLLSTDLSAQRNKGSVTPDSGYFLQRDVGSFLPSANYPPAEPFVYPGPVPKTAIDSLKKDIVDIMELIRELGSDLAQMEQNAQMANQANQLSTKGAIYMLQGMREDHLRLDSLIRALNMRHL